MHRFARILLCAIAPLWAWPQANGQYFLERQEGPNVEDPSGRAFPLAWTGGLIHASAANADLDGDGTVELLLYDKSGPKWLPLSPAPAGSPFPWRTAPGLAERVNRIFPDAAVFALLQDYDGDGDLDLLSYRDNGLVAFRNVRSETGTLGFSPYNGSRTLRSAADGSAFSLSGSGLEVPAFEDADGDGDLDLLRFDSDGAFVELHANRSLEWYGHRDSLVFELVTACWARFRENAGDAGIALDSCHSGLLPGGGGTGTRFGRGLQTASDQRYVPSPTARADVAHAAFKSPHLGSTLLLSDWTGDGDPDLLIGDSGSGRLTFLRIQGQAMAAVADSVNPSWPPVHPAFTYQLGMPSRVDLNGDGAPDLLVSPNAGSLSDNHRGLQAWFGDGSPDTEGLSFAGQGFLQRDMLDFGRSAGPVAADVDADGDMDLLIGNAGYRNASGPLPARLSWLENTGLPAPRFVLRDTDYAGISALGLVEARPAFGDLDGDGDGDLLIGDQDGRLHFYRNTGTPDSPVWSLAEEDWQGIDVGANAVPQLLDLNADGLLDLIIGEKNGNLNRYDALPGSGDAVFVLQDGNWGGVDVRDGGAFGIGQAAPWLFASPQADRFEVLVGANGGRIHYYNNVHPDIGPFALYDSNFAAYGEGARAMPAMADFDGDGLGDLVIGNSSGGLVWYQGVGSNGWSAPDPAALHCRPNPLVAGQLLETSAAHGGRFTVHDAQGQLRAGGVTRSGCFPTAVDWGPGLYVLRVQAPLSCAVRSPAQCRFILLEP